MASCARLWFSSSVVASVLLLHSATAQDPKEPILSGRFNTRGFRFEQSPIQSGIRKATEAEWEAHQRSCKTIEEWARLAMKARSRGFRTESAGTLASIARRAQNERRLGDEKLTNEERLRLSLSEDEKAHLRRLCIQVAENASDADTSVKSSMLDALLALANKDCIPTFNRLIEDESEYVAKTAIEGTGLVGDDSSVAALLAFLTKESKQARSNYSLVARALGSIGSAAARDALEHVYKNSKFPQYKEAAGYQLDVLDSKK